MKVLITGAFGMIGRALMKDLEKAGHELRFLDISHPSEATVFVPGKTERQASPVKINGEFIQGQITDSATVNRAVAGMDAVINLAAGVTGLPEFGAETMHTNVCGTYIILDEARKAGVKRVLVASSINAYGCFYWRLSGRPPVYSSVPIDESYPPCVEDPYSLSKLVNEETCAAFTRAYGMTTAAFRFAGVWNRELYEQTLHDGLQPTQDWSDDLYQWVHVDDVAQGLVRALESKNLPPSGVYTLGAPDTRCPEPTMEILEKYRPDLAAAAVDPVPGRWPLLSIKTAADAFGYSPEYRLAP